MAELVHLPIHPHPVIPVDTSRLLYCSMCWFKNEETEPLRKDGYKCIICEWASHRECAEKETVQLPSHPHPLTPLNVSRLFCGMCRHGDAESSDAYSCGACSLAFHKECAESPVQMNHPYHPRHLLSLRPLDDDDKAGLKCNSCGEEIWKEYTIEWVYECRICKFFLHIRCANEPHKLHVDRPKFHDHTLSLLPRPLPFTCNACGFIKDRSLPYVCLQCDFMVHRDCIDLPRVIRICRHHHRLSHSFSLPPLHHEAWSCRVCFKPIDNNYGGYSCNKGCRYAVHVIQGGIYGTGKTSKESPKNRMKLPSPRSRL